MIATNGLFQATKRITKCRAKRRRDHRSGGASSGQVATPGHLPRRAADRGGVRCRTTDSLRQQAERATSARSRVPVDASHGMIGDIQAGDRVDVYGGLQRRQRHRARQRPVLDAAAARTSLVLKAPAKRRAAGSSGNETQVVLRVPDTEVGEDRLRRRRTARSGSCCGRRPAPSRLGPPSSTVETILFGRRAGRQPVRSSEAADDRRPDQGARRARRGRRPATCVQTALPSERP